MSRRLQLALNVNDISEAITFYSRLFGTEPAKARLAGAEERDTTCCYARQDKFWVRGAPDGESWEIYTVLADSPTFYGEGHGEACCGGTGQPGEPAVSHDAPCC